MSPEDAQQLAGTPHNRGGGRVDHRWGRTKRKIGFLTVAAHHDLDRGPVATDATDDVTQDLRGCDIKSVPDTGRRPHAIFKAGSLRSTSRSSQSSWPLAIANIRARVMSL